MRVDEQGRALMRVVPQARHRNANGLVHGGFLMGLVDQSLFYGPAILVPSGAVAGVTVEAGAQFMAPVEIGRPVDAIAELLRETGRMMFVRGTIEQDGRVAVAFSGVVRKLGGGA